MITTSQPDTTRYHQCGYDLLCVHRAGSPASRSVLYGSPNQRCGHGAVQAPSPFAPQHAAQTIACRFGWMVVAITRRTKQFEWGLGGPTNRRGTIWTRIHHKSIDLALKSTTPQASKEFGWSKARNAQNPLQNDASGPLLLTKSEKGPNQAKII